MTKELVKSVKSAKSHFDEYLSSGEKEKQLEAIPADVVIIKNKKSALGKIVTLSLKILKSWWIKIWWKIIWPWF